MVDAHVPTTDGRELRLTRHTQPEPELQLQLERLLLTQPAQPPPPHPLCDTDLSTPHHVALGLTCLRTPESAKSDNLPTV